MISYLKGNPIEVIKNTNNRVILVLEVNEVGYELQIPSKLGREISQEKLETIQVFTHLQIKDDQQILYGFSTTAERDLFRQLISVSGIGAQSAIALIDTLGLEELVQAIVTANIRILSRTPGIGKKTAEKNCLRIENQTITMDKTSRSNCHLFFCHAILRNFRRYSDDLIRPRLY